MVEWQDEQGRPKIWIQWAWFFAAVIGVGITMGLVSDVFTMPEAMLDLFVFHAPFLMLIHYSDYLSKKRAGKEKSPESNQTQIKPETLQPQQLF